MECRRYLDVRSRPIEKEAECPHLLVERDFQSQVARAHHELLDCLGARLRRRFLGGVAGCGAGSSAAEPVPRRRSRLQRRFLGGVDQLAYRQHHRVPLVNRVLLTAGPAGDRRLSGPGCMPPVALVNLIFDLVRHERFQLVVHAARLTNTVSK